MTLELPIGSALRSFGQLNRVKQGAIAELLNVSKDVYRDGKAAPIGRKWHNGIGSFSWPSQEFSRVLSENVAVATRIADL